MSRWSSAFNDTATFGNYISRLQKACFLLRQSTSWLTPAVRHVVKLLKKAQNKSFRSANFIRSQPMVEIVDQESPGSEFARGDSPLLALFLQGTVGGAPDAPSLVGRRPVGVSTTEGEGDHWGSSRWRRALP